MAAFADLNISRQTDPRETEKLVLKAIQLGFETIAISTTFSLKSDKHKKSEKVRLTPFNWDEFPEICELKKKRPKLKFLSRLTVPLDDQSHVHQLSMDEVKSYDILAIQPNTEKLFQQCCKSLAVDIISLDMSNRLPFYLRFPTLNAAIERGVHFEIVYSPALRDTTLRRYLISNALELVNFTKGKNVILSSGAENQMDFRGPYDLVNLGLLFDLKEEQSKAAVSKNCRAVLFHSESRKGTGRSVISGKLLTSLSGEELWTLPGACKEDDVSEDEASEKSGDEEEISDGDRDNSEDDEYEPKEKKAKAGNEEVMNEEDSDVDDEYEPEEKKAKK